MEFIREKIKKNIQTQFEQPISDLNSTQELLKKELEGFQLCRQKTKRLLDDVRQSTTELRGLLSDLEEKLPVSSSRPAGRTVHPPEGPLAEVLHAADLRLVDIGGRLGPLSNFLSLTPFTSLFICEPDPEAAKQLLQEQGNPADALSQWKRVVPFTDAIAEKPGTVSLNITRQPGLSSLLKPNTAVVSNYYGTEDWEIEKTEQVPAITLDAAAEKYQFGSPLLLKLDTQGSELQILKSGPQVLKKTVGVYLEMNNLEFYSQQPSFAEVDAFLREQGFTLVDIKRTLLRRQTKERPVYSKRELAWSHGLYLKLGNSTLADVNPSFGLSLFTIAVCMEFFDLAVAILECPALAASFKEKWDLGLLKNAVCKQSNAVFSRLAETVSEDYQEALKTFCHRDRKWER